MEKKPFWEANSSLPSQKFLNTLLKHKTHYCVHKSPTQVSAVSKITPVHSTQSYLSKVHFNIILSFTPMSMKQPLSFMLPLYCFSLMLCHILSPAHPPTFDNPDNFWRGLQFFLCYLFPHRIIQVTQRRTVC